METGLISNSPLRLVIALPFMFLFCISEISQNEHSDLRSSLTVPFKAPY